MNIQSITKPMAQRVFPTLRLFDRTRATRTMLSLPFPRPVSLSASENEKKVERSILTFTILLISDEETYNPSEFFRTVLFRYGPSKILNGRRAKDLTEGGRFGRWS